MTTPPVPREPGAAGRPAPGIPAYVAYKPPLYHPDFPFILLWSQKAGCTTVVNWFFDQVGLLGEARAHHPWIHFYEVEVYKRRPGYRKDLLAALGSGRYTVVKVVRDPFRRAASAFLTLADKASPRPDHWSARYWQQAHEWLAATGRDPAAGLSFLDHLEHLCAREREGFRTVNPHAAQQHVPGEEEAVEELVPIERFVEWAKAAEAARGLKRSDHDDIASSAHHHRTDPRRTALLGDRAEEYRIQRGSFGDNRFPDGRVLVNPRTLGPLHAAYARDVAAYGHLYDIAPRSEGWMP